MGLNSPLAIEILEIAAQRPEGIALPVEASRSERLAELRQTFEVLITGGFLAASDNGRYVLTRQGSGLIDALRRRIQKDEDRKKRLSTLVLEVLRS